MALPEWVVLKEAEFWQKIQRTAAAGLPAGALVFNGATLVRGRAFDRTSAQDAFTLAQSIQAAGRACVLVESAAGYTLWHEPQTAGEPPPPPFLRTGIPQPIAPTPGAAPAPAPGSQSGGGTLSALAEQMRATGGVEVRDRLYQFRPYSRACVGSEVVEWLMRTQGIAKRQALELGQQLMDQRLIRNLDGESQFRDGNSFYRFLVDDQTPVATEPEPVAPERPAAPSGTLPQDLVALVAQLRSPGGLTVSDRWYQFRRYERCFTAAELVEWLMRTQGITKRQALDLGQALVDQRAIRHVGEDIPFLEGNTFYTFTTD
ncbi:MAG: hypothetical protein IGQ88_12790 [Gloeomargaritaceae cyanobacterium C42_A2020_066]|nr:hypothetical protein [Gloeomargaritaceae cyanobacterium C42_A2020_066]